MTRHLLSPEHKPHEAEIKFLRSTFGGEQLSAEMLDLLARLIFDDYELFPGPGRSGI